MPPDVPDVFSIRNEATRPAALVAAANLAAFVLLVVLAIVLT
jgi:hypothetical protein